MKRVEPAFLFVCQDIKRLSIENMISFCYINRDGKNRLHFRFL